MKPPIDSHIGKKLRNIRILAGMSQDKLGELTGVTFQQIQKYEIGLNRISASRLYELANVLDQPIAVFFEDYIPTPDYYNFAIDELKDKFKTDKIKNKEIISLVRSFNKISDFMIRKSVISLLNSISAHEGNKSHGRVYNFNHKVYFNE